MIVKWIDFLRDHLKPVIVLCLAALGALVAYDLLFVDKSPAHTSWEHMPGFWAAFGFVACVLIIILSKWFGHAGIMTREDYYDD